MEEPLSREGGFGWVVVCASFVMQACSFGLVSGFGVFFEHYARVVFPDTTKAQLSMIGTIAPMTMAFGSAITGRVCDVIGARLCVLLGAVFCGMGMFLAGFASTVWQLVLTQGLVFGLGGALVYVPANTVVAEWFVRRRGVAIGIAAAGSGVGGLVFSLLNGYLLEREGKQTCLFINAAILFVMLGGSALVIRSSPKHVARPPFKPAALFSPRLVGFAVAMLCAGLSFLVPIYYMPAYATKHGLSPSQGAWLVGTMNLASAVGRIAFGLLGDFLGHANVFIASLFLSSLALLIWHFNTQFSPLCIFAIIYGLASGGFAGGFSATCAELFGMENLATIMGVAYAPTGLGDLIGPTIGGAIIDATGDYRNLIIYTMSLFLLSSSLVLLTRFLKPSFH
ncbi:hypothetical protein DSO57_1018664 [Entomophthora muscae]|uniref:Uncharacterized protein n=1 Tax=Entomophthora muscae TaxID=34485 RepID=A0ACC2U2K5_9FUNG|nr:hypothetical protein DSO57_1018664 [Entomophthora muscae]